MKLRKQNNPKFDVFIMKVNIEQHTVMNLSIYTHFFTSNIYG